MASLQEKLDECEARNKGLQDLLLNSGIGGIRVGDITTNNMYIMNQQEFGVMMKYDPKAGIMFFGTCHDDLVVRFHNPLTVIEDITSWITKNDLRGPVSPDAIRTVLNLE